MGEGKPPSYIPGLHPTSKREHTCAGRANPKWLPVSIRSYTSSPDKPAFFHLRRILMDMEIAFPSGCERILIHVFTFHPLFARPHHPFFGTRRKLHREEGLGKESAMAFVRNPSQHSPVAISESRPDRESNPGPSECESSELPLGYLMRLKYFAIAFGGEVDSKHVLFSPTVVTGRQLLGHAPFDCEPTVVVSDIVRGRSDSMPRTSVKWVAASSGATRGRILSFRVINLRRSPGLSDGGGCMAIRGFEPGRPRRTKWAINPPPSPTPSSLTHATDGPARGRSFLRDRARRSPSEGLYIGADMKRVWISTVMKRRGKREIPEKTHQPAASSGARYPHPNIWEWEVTSLPTPTPRLLCMFVTDGKREIPEKTRRSAATSVTISTCDNPGIEPGSPWWEASSLTTTTPRPHCILADTSTVVNRKKILFV
ncbi:hypothetical protein PR048_022774, partial [Dryococelus australis]